ncbi:MAG TPA: DUF4097 family beta strand repeat-containing protein [Blastocatellia bacterium]|nr:DUF4097 family beta strand repeat-containing protein [Blastocatellia bacterium]
MLLTICLMLMSFSGLSSTDEWTKSYNVAAKPRVRVETSDANIRVTTSEGETVTARVTTVGWKIGGDGINIVEHQSGDQIDIEIRFPHRVFQVNWGNHRVDIEITVPRHAGLDLHTGDGNVDVQGVSGAIVARTGDGNLKLSELTGTLRANTGDGNIDMRDVRGELNLHTGDGRIDATGIDGSLRAETGDGRIRVNGRFDLLDVRTGDGGIDASANAGSKLDANWLLSTGDGDLTMRLQETISADVELHTSDGHIDLNIPVTVLGRAGRQEIHGRINAGGKLLSLKTGDGSIRLEKLETAK